MFEIVQKRVSSRVPETNQSSHLIEKMFFHSADKEIVVELYKKGLQELEKGISINLSNYSDPSWDRPKRLRQKMETNLIMVQDRLQFLSKFFGCALSMSFVRLYHIDKILISDHLYIYSAGHEEW